MSDDVSADWFLGVGGEHGGSVHLRNHLICYHDCHAKLHSTSGTRMPHQLICGTLHAWSLQQ